MSWGLAMPNDSMKPKLLEQCHRKRSLYDRRSPVKSKEEVLRRAFLDAEKDCRPDSRFESWGKFPLDPNVSKDGESPCLA